MKLHPSLRTRATRLTHDPDTAPDAIAVSNTYR
jgi:hypothetical protein